MQRTVKRVLVGIAIAASLAWIGSISYSVFGHGDVSLVDATPQKFGGPIGPGAGLTRVATNSPGLLAGSGTSGAPLTATLSVGSGLSGTGSSGSPLVATGGGGSGGGSVTSIATTAPIAGGTITTTGTLSLNEGSGMATDGSGNLTFDNTVIQSRVSGTCTAPNAIASVSATGTVTCTTGEATTSTGTANTIAKYSTATNVANSLLTDNATTLSYNAGKLTVTASSGNLTSAGSGTFSGGLRATTGTFSSEVTATPPAGGTGILSQFSGTASTAGFTGLSVNDPGSTFDTTSSAVQINAAVISSTGSRSTGTNALTNVGLDVTASGGQTNIALQSDDGDVLFNQSSGSAAFGSDVTVENKILADGGERVVDIAGIGLTQTANQIAMMSCVSTGQYLAWNNSSSTWVCTAASGGGTVTSIATTAPILGGTITSTGTISLDFGSGLTTSGSALVVDNTVEQARVSGTCAQPNAILSIGSSGTVTCTTGEATTSTGTANTLSKYSAGSAISNSAETDDGTTFSVGTKLAVTEATGNLVGSGSGSFVGTLTADSGNRVVDTAGTGLAQTANSLAVNVAGASCSGGSFVSAISATGTGTCTAGSTGTVTSSTMTANNVVKATGASALGNSALTDDGTTFSVNAGKLTVTEASGNMTGSGSATFVGTLTADAGNRVLDAVGAGLSQTANSVAVNIAGASCSGGSFVSAISATGTGTCTAGSSGTVTSGTLTANTLTKASTASNIVNSVVTDDATTFSVNGKLSVLEASGNLTGSGSGTFVGTLTADSGSRVIDTVGTGLSQTANSVALNITPTTCSSGSGVTAVSASGVATCTADVIAVTNGTGISTSTSAGTATVTLNEAGASCSAGSAVTAMSATGTGTCAVGLVTNGVANTIPKYSAAGVLNVSVEKDDGTNFTVGSGSAVKIVEASGNTTIAGTLGVTGAFTGSATGAFTGTLTADAGNRVIDTAGIGLSQTANQIAMMSCVTVGNYLAWSGTAWACTSVGTTTNAPYGFGIDGALTYDGTSTVLGVVPSSSVYKLTRDVFATTVAISSGVTINENGYRFHASTSITFADSTAGFSNDGSAGGSGSAGVSGASGAGGGLGSIGGTDAVINGAVDTYAGGSGAASSIAGGSGISADSDPQGFTGTGGAGGIGTGAQAPGGGGTVAFTGGWSESELLMFAPGKPAVLGDHWACGAGGGGGGADASGSGDGGGGGGGGGCMYIATPKIVSTTGSGLIHSNGGNGGNGANGTTHCGGGGGGGGGGLIVIVTSTVSAAQYTASETAGTGGAAGCGSTAQRGANGGAGRLVVIDPGSPGNGGGTSTGTVTSITAGTGLTGGTITASGTLAIDNTVVQETSGALVSGCGSGSALGAIAANGTPTCVSTGGGLSGTSGALTRWATSSTLGTSAATDDGTTLTTGSFAYGEVSQTLGASGTINNYAIGSAGAYYEITTVGTTIITGITNGTPGRRITVYNVAGGPITWNNLSASSSVGNRLTMVASVSTWVTASGEYIDFVYSGTDSTWHQVQTEHFAAIVDAGALNVGGTLTLSSVVNGTGRFSITNGAAQSSVFATTTGAQTTNNLQALGGTMAGSFNTTAGALTEVSVTGTTTSTRSSGTNALTGIGGQFSASGAQVNYAIQTTAGSVDFATGHINDTGGTAPNPTGCGTTGLTVTGTDISGTVIEGTGATGCTLTFAVSYNGNGTTTDSCIVTPHGIQAIFGYTEAAATLVVTNTSAETFSYICHGH